MLTEPPLLTIRRTFPRPTPAQVAALTGVPTGFICDALGGTGGLHTTISPLIGGQATGPALVADNGPEEILATRGAMHIMEPGDVIVSATRGCQTVAAAGDHFMGMLRNKGAAGFVTDGPVRDLAGIRAVGLPVWCTGLNPNSPFSKGPGRVGFSCVVGGQMIASGDMIVADENGVVVIPFAQIDTVIAGLSGIQAAEDAMEAKIAAGFCEQTMVEDMLADGRAVIAD